MKRVTATALMLILTLTACGVPADDEPRNIPAGQVPFDLLAPSTTQAATTVPVATLPASVYLVRNNRLTEVTRTVAAPVSLGGVFAALIQGTTDSEAAAGTRSVVSPQTRVLGTEVMGGTATVNLSADAFLGLGVRDQILALAQLTYTATALSGVDRVQIRINSEDTAVPMADGTLTRDPLTRGDYDRLAPLQE